MSEESAFLKEIGEVNVVNRLLNEMIWSWLREKNSHEVFLQSVRDFITKG